MITRIEIDGLKGGPVAYDLRGVNVVWGPNGSGKTRIADAIHFLLGRDVAGQEVDGRTVRALLAGDHMRVSALVVDDDGTEHLVVRERSIKRGAFCRSSITVDGAHDDGSALRAIVGGRPPPGGLSWIDATQGQLTDQLARIGAAAEGGAEIVRAAFVAATEHDDGRLTGGETPRLFSGVQSLGWAEKAAKDELNDARRHLRSVEAGTDRSRGEIEDRIDPQAVAQAQAALFEAQAARDEAAKAVGRIQSEHSEAIRIAEQIEQARRDGGVSPPTKEEIRLARSGLDEASAARRAADKALAEIRAKESAARDAIREAKAPRPPCFASRRWIDGDEIPGPGGPVPIDLGSRCEWVSRSMTRSPRLRADAEKRAQALARGCDKARAEADAATEAHRDAIDHLAKLRAAEDASKVLAQPASAAVGRDKEVAVAKAAYMEAVVAASACSGALEAAVTQRERARRLQADRDAARAASARLEAAKSLKRQVERAQARLLELGAERILELVQPAMPGGWKAEIRDSRIGLEDGEAFWFGPALSAGQRAVLGLAIDRALGAIYSTTYRLAVVEADTLDDQVRQAVLRTLIEDVRTGSLSQALVLQWAPAPEIDGVHPIRIGGGVHGDLPESWAPARTPDVDEMNASEMESMLRGRFGRRRVPRQTAARRALLRRLLDAEAFCA